MKRSTFIQSSCQTCLLLAAGWMLPALEGCGPASYQVLTADMHDGLVAVAADAFLKGPLVVVRPRGWFYSIALRKQDERTYTALLLKCTHQDNQLTASAGGYSCSLHGSAFNPEGKVVKGPAERALVSYPVTIENNHLIIHTKA
jgi:Rieske Fe-S protein